MKPKTGAERQAKYKASGRPVSVVIRDKKAIRELQRLIAKHGGETAAIVAALKGDS